MSVIGRPEEEPVELPSEDGLSDLVIPSSRSHAITGGLNVGIRGLTMLSKFVLVWVLARYLGEEANGWYRQIYMTVTTVMTFLSVRFDLYTTRELCSDSRETHLSMVRNQFLFHGLMYVVFLPWTLLLFVQHLLPWWLAIPFYCMLFAEHASNEISRLLIPLSKPVHSNFLMFLRNGLWVYVLALLFFVSKSSRHLEFVWVGWGIGALVSIVLGGFWLYHGVNGFGLQRIDWAWIKRGIRQSFVLSLGMGFMTATFTIDNYILRHYRTDAIVGVYAIYSQISNLIQTVGETGVAIVILPVILTAFARREMASFDAQMRRLNKSILISCAAGFLIALAGSAVALPLLDRKTPGHAVYGAHLDAFLIMLLMGIFNNVALAPHYGLYARKGEASIAVCNGIGLVVAAILFFALTPSMGIVGTAWGGCIAMAVVYVTKLIAYKRLAAKQRAEFQAA